MTRPEYWIGSARQGGFSSLSLPLPGYCGGGILVCTDGSRRFVTPEVVTLEPNNVNPYNEGTSARDLWAEGPNEYATGGPFGGPFFRYTSLVEASGPELLIGSGDFTLEGWFRWDRSYVLSAWPVLNTWVSGSYGFAFYTYADGPTNDVVEFWEISPAESYTLHGKTVIASEWFHLAVARQGTTLAGWFNGAQMFSLSRSTAYNSSSLSAQGSDFGQMRFTPRSARYSGSTITVPTAPFI